MFFQFSLHFGQFVDLEGEEEGVLDEVVAVLLSGADGDELFGFVSWSELFDRKRKGVCDFIIVVPGLEADDFWDDACLVFAFNLTGMVSPQWPHK